MLQSYWDESGHAADLKIRYFGIAGLVARAERWRAFEAEWCEILAEFELAYFHMVEYAQSRGLFEHKEAWPESRRRELLSRLLSAVARTEPRLFGAIMDLHAWRGLTPEEQGWFLDPYYPCAQECIRLATIHADTVGQDSIEVVFSQTTEFAGRARLLWDVVRDPSVPVTRLDEVEMADMRTCLPLQAADLFAYEIVKGVDSVRRGANLRYPLLKLLGLDWRAWVSYFDGDQIHDQCQAVHRFLAAGGTL